MVRRQDDREFLPEGRPNQDEMVTPEQYGEAHFANSDALLPKKGTVEARGQYDETRRWAMETFIVGPYAAGLRRGLLAEADGDAALQEELHDLYFIAMRQMEKAKGGYFARASRLLLEKDREGRIKLRDDCWELMSVSADAGLAEAANVLERRAERVRQEAERRRIDGRRAHVRASIASITRRAFELLPLGNEGDALRLEGDAAMNPRLAEAYERGWRDALVRCAPSQLPEAQGRVADLRSGALLDLTADTGEREGNSSRGPLAKAYLATPLKMVRDEGRILYQEPQVHERQNKAITRRREEYLGALFLEAYATGEREALDAYRKERESLELSAQFTGAVDIAEEIGRRVTAEGEDGLNFDGLIDSTPELETAIAKCIREFHAGDTFDIRAHVEAAMREAFAAGQQAVLSERETTRRQAAEALRLGLERMEARERGAAIGARARGSVPLMAIAHDEVRELWRVAGAMLLEVWAEISGNANWQDALAARDERARVLQEGYRAGMRQIIAEVMGREHPTGPVPSRTEKHDTTPDNTPQSRVTTARDWREKWRAHKNQLDKEFGASAQAVREAIVGTVLSREWTDGHEVPNYFRVRDAALDALDTSHPDLVARLRRETYDAKKSPGLVALEDAIESAWQNREELRGQYGLQAEFTSAPAAPEEGDFTLEVEQGTSNDSDDDFGKDLFDVQ